jgi:hypothetical protein
MVSLKDNTLMLSSKLPFSFLLLGKLTSRQELKRLREAATAVGGPNYKPKFTFVVCAKRHNMRFFAINPADADRTGNLPPGTVVEKGVTHPYAFDFYRTSAEFFWEDELMNSPGPRWIAGNC